MLCCILALVLLFSSLSFATAAVSSELAPTGYYNSSLYETYASSASSATDLGCTYTPSATTFKVWAPEATSVMVRLYTTGTDNESGAGTISTTSMTYNSTSGIWSLTLSGDHKDQYYTYLVERDGVTRETQDPYAHAVGANGDRSMVVDLDSTDPEGWDSDQHVLFDNPGEAVVWEVHVRDFSISASSGVSDENKGKYLAFTEGDTTVNGAGSISTCVDYLVEHNINCVQLMPIEDFASVDETSDAVQYNWGYDPKNYNVPEGSYSSNPYDGNTRITEFKMLVQALHDRGISVVMDVVYNHTFVLEGSPLSLTTPKYFYRMSSSTDYYNGTGLGNVLSSEKTMTRKYISDSLCYWANEYHIDGFRFDLMGCFDLGSLKAWRSDLDKISSKILMYGEPWIGGDNNGITDGLTNGNINQLTRVGAFNQTYSDSLKGAHEVSSATAKGFVSGGSATEVLNAAGGSATYFPGAKVNQFINYTDNHDNLIMFDKLLAANGLGITVDDDNTSLYDTNRTVVNNTSSAILGQMKLALTAALTSQGTPFTVAGTEFCRTKYGEANSYRSPDRMNSIDWTRASTYKDVADYYAGLAAIRKAFSAFGDATSDSITTVSGGCTAYRINNSKSGQWSSIIVALNNSSSAKNITLSGSWTVVANGTKAGTASLGTASGSYSVPAYAGVVLVDSASFGNYTQPNTGTASLTVEHYTRDSASGSYTKVRTETAKFKEGQTYRASKNLNILFDHNLDTVDSSTGVTYGTAVAGQNITVKFYYTRYIKSGYLVVNFLNTSTGNQVSTPMRYRMRDGDAYSIPNTAVQGYQLDTTRYPGGTRGSFDADHPVSFNFYYRPLSNDTTIVHYYNSKNWSTVMIYAYYTDDEGQLQEPAGDWNAPRTQIGMAPDTATNAARGETGWYVKEVNCSSFYVMFHDLQSHQVPGVGESGYSVSGEAWIKDGVVQFNNTIVTSHIDLETGEQVSQDVVRNNTSVRSDQIYATSPDTSLLRNYITPANASGFYEAGVTNVVYLYTDERDIGGDGLLYGDADLNDAVEITDATILQQHLAHMRTLSDTALSICDVDSDGEVTITDATYIQRYLAHYVDADNRTGTRNGDVDTGKHSFNELLEVYNELTSELAKYSASRYGSDPYYQAAAEAVTKYKAVTMNPGSTADEIDEAYDACKAALDGLDNITIIEAQDITLYFSNNKGWDTVYVYVWGAAGDNSWPGYAASYVGNNDYGEGIYSVTVDLLSYNNAIFNNNGDQQTADIALFDGMQNGCYCTDDTDESGHYIVGFYSYSGTSGGGGSDEPITPSGSKLYMVPSYEWQSAGGRYAAYFFAGSSNAWVNMKYVSDSLYSVDIPSGYEGGMVIFCRMSTATENNWDNKLDQTADLSFTAGGTYNIGTGSWS